MDAFSALNSLVSKATSDDPEPTAGFLLKEVATATHASLEDCRRVEEYVLRRLAKKSPHVKAKALTLVKHLAKTGRSDFKRNLQRNTDKIKECLQYRGPPDPLRGDEYSRRVRDAAKEALEAVFSEDAAPTDRLGGMPMAAIGNAAFSPIAPDRRLASGRAEGGGSGRMQGMGNPHFEPASDTRDVGGAFMDKLRTLAKLPMGRGGDVHSRLDLPPGTAPVDGWSFASNRGPNAVTRAQPTYASPGHSGYAFGTSPGNKAGFAAEVDSRDAVASASTFGQAGSAGRAATDGKYERALVVDVTAPGGMRAVPVAEKLQQFCECCRTLDADLVGKLLCERLDDDSWQVQHKALAVVAALASAPGCGHLRDFFADPARGLEQVRALESSSTPSIRRKAHEVVEAVLAAADSESSDSSGSEASSEEEPAPRRRAKDSRPRRRSSASTRTRKGSAGRAKEEPSLLAFNEEPQSGGAGGSAAGGPDLADMFAGLTTGGISSAAAAAPSSEAGFEFLQGSGGAAGTSRRPSAAGARGELDMFGDLVVKAAPAAAATAARGPASAAPVGNGGRRGSSSSSGGGGGLDLLAFSSGLGGGSEPHASVSDSGFDFLGTSGSPPSRRPSNASARGAAPSSTHRRSFSDSADPFAALITHDHADAAPGAPPAPLGGAAHSAPFASAPGGPSHMPGSQPVPFASMGTMHAGPRGALPMMHMAMPAGGVPSMPGGMTPQQMQQMQMQQMQHMQRMQQMQQMQQMHAAMAAGRAGMGPGGMGSGAAPTHRPGVAGGATLQRTPSSSTTGSAKPRPSATGSDSGFGFMQPEEQDAFSFVSDAMRSM